jgi:hypothetical protein
MRRRPVTHNLLVVSLLLLTACGAADGDGPTDVGAGVEGPADDQAGDGADGAAGACLEGEPDCVDADLGGDAGSGDGAGPPDGDLTFDLGSARRDAESLLGEPEEDVLELWDDVRVGRRGDEEMALTFDLQPGRKTIATEDDGTGTYRVVEVVLETEDGSETFTAE